MTEDASRAWVAQQIEWGRQVVDAMPAEQRVALEAFLADHPSEMSPELAEAFGLHHPG